MSRLFKGEGWVEAAFALIAISVFGVWMVTVVSHRLTTPTLWETWQSQHQPVPAERVAASAPSPSAPLDRGAALAAK